MGKLSLRMLLESLLNGRRPIPKILELPQKKALAIIQRPIFKWYRGGLDVWKQQPDNAANGGLMRNGIIPALFYHKDDTIAALDATVCCCIITHFGPLPVLCSVVHTLLIREAFFNEYKNAPTLEFIREIFFSQWQRWKVETQNSECKFWLKELTEEALQQSEEQLFRELKGFENEFYYGMNFEGKSGYCVLTLKIALWALHWSFQQKAPKIPEWLPDWPFQRHAFDTIMWVVLIGADADTYAATAGSLLGAFHPNINLDFFDGLQAANDIADCWRILEKSTNKSNKDK